ncbi:MAG: SURF1 family protein [Xanthomonadales bacterium]|nr:SURF1 family protein [Xanthomonadales bacterium]
MARHWYRPGAFAVLLTLAGLAVFISLGSWQVRRGQEKARLFAAFDSMVDTAPVPLDRARREATPGSYQRVQVTGSYDPLHAYILDNQVREGRSGIMLFDVFEPRDGSTPLLVNRGFLARDPQGTIPQVPAPPPGEQTLDAIYAPPPGIGLRLGGNALPGQAGWPKTSIYLDIAEVGADLGRSLDPRVLLLEPAPGSPFVREWRPGIFPPERHWGYAATWYGFAALCLVLFAVRHWR